MFFSLVTKFLKHLPANEHYIDGTRNIDWVFIEISSECKILIYKNCVKEFTEIIKNKFSKSVLYNSKERPLSEVIQEASVLVGWRFPEELLQKAVNLKWIQLISASLSLTEKKHGIPNYICHDVIITTAKGLYSDSVADYVIWSILTLSRKLHLVLKAQTHRNWAQHIGDDIKGKTVGILGLGKIGSSVAEKASALGMKIFAIKRHYASKHNIPHIDKLYPINELAEFLGNIDFLVVCLPFTHETRGLIGRDEFKHMKNSAFLIDISKGGVVRHRELIYAVKNKIIAGAALDVFEEEPLPRDSELWNSDNVIITPHISGITVDYAQKVGSFFCDNLKRFIEGRDLMNIINKAEGY